MSDDYKESDFHKQVIEKFPNTFPLPQGQQAFQHEMSESFWRDWFAGQAMAAFITGNTMAPTMDKDELAEMAYEQADSMLTARKQ